MHKERKTIFIAPEIALFVKEDVLANIINFRHGVGLRHGSEVFLNGDKVTNEVNLYEIQKEASGN